MHDLLVPDIALLEKWLDKAGYETSICEECNGLHVNAMQAEEGVVDSRLFVEPWGVVFTTELDVRNAAILPLTADLLRLNMSFPTIKLFVNTPDDTGAMLVASSFILTTQGVTIEQFDEFFGVTLETVRQLLQECQQMQYLFQGDERMMPVEAEDGIKPSLH